MWRVALQNSHYVFPFFYGMGHGRYRLAADDPSRVVMTKGKREIFSLAEKQGSSAEKPPGGSLVGVASAQQEQ